MRQLIRVVNWFAVLLVSSGLAFSQAKDMTFDERTQLDSALERISKDVVKHYYDPKLHSVDWDEKVRQTRDKIKDEKSLNMGIAHVAALLDSLNDSHTFLLPPPRPYVLDHGWAVQMIGDKCYVIRVRPGGDAEAHGVKPGDQLVSINGYRVGRDNLWKIEYTFNVLRPQPKLTVVLRNNQGEEHRVLLEAKFTDWQIAQLYGSTIFVGHGEYSFAEEQIHIAEYGKDLAIVKMPSFMFDENATNKALSQFSKHNAVILDLRGNPGGSVETLKRMVGKLFAHDVQISDRVGREGSKPVIARADHHPFEGKLIVLIDSKSASASELLARVVQLEKRGVVIGDRSSGSVMEAREYTYPVRGGGFLTTVYGASITDANLIMQDGKSLEHVGVEPDEVLLPSAADLASNHDPVLAHAAGLAGVTLTPEEAGTVFPYDWPTKH